MMSFRGLLGVVVAMLVACTSGDSPSSFEGCGSDADCKGDRICMSGMCVDPDADGTGDGDGDSVGDGDSDSVGDGDGDGDTAGDGDGDTGGPTFIDSPELEAACIRDCEAKHAADCEMPIGSLDQCMAQCLVADEINGGYCLDERRRQYDCLANGGYTCVSGYPRAKSTCIAETQDVSTCGQEFPCRRFCEEVEDTECAPDGDCFETCRGTEQGFEDTVCGYDYTRLLTCWNQNPACDGDRLSIADCQPQVVEIADCIGLRTGECEGYCWTADLLGCGADDCLETCLEKKDDSACGYLYRRLLECAWDDRQTLNLACVDDAPEFTEACDSARMEYQTCLEP